MKCHTRKFRKLNLTHYVLITGFLLIFHNEVFLYWFDTFAWPKATVGCRGNCTKFLIVADPQILGYEQEPYGLGVVTCWDSDRYLEKSYGFALGFVKPDAVIFLGDLIDEGSTSSTEDFKSYQARFKDLFKTSTINSKVLYIAGDNDIGGEGSDPVTDEKVSKFTKAFPTEQYTLVNAVNFIPVSRIVPSFKIPEVPVVDTQWRVALSHIPITYIYSRFSVNVLESLRPHAIFSAHSHRASVAASRGGSFTVDTEDLTRSGPIRKKLNSNETIEVIWPTCSYRMGERRMAYGAAIIYEDGTMDIAFLWLHSRFESLAVYLIFIILSTSAALYKKFRK